MATIRELVTLLGFDLKDAPLKEYERKIQSAKKKTQGLSSTMKGVSTAIKWIGGTVAAAGFAALGKSILDTTGEVEQYRVTLGTMIGDQEKANKIIHDLDYSPVSDFYGTAAAIGGLQGMVTFGMQAEEASETLTRLGDIAQGNGEAFKSLSLNMGQVFAKGKADATDLKQFVGQGFDVVGEISKMTGKSRAEIEKAGVAYEQCAAALEHITGEGGKYNGMLAKQSQTLPGLIKQFQSLTAAIKESIGTAVLNSVKQIMQFFLQTGKSMQDNIAAVGTKVFDTIIRGVVDVIEFFEILIIRMRRFGGAFTTIKALISDVLGFLGSVIESAYPFLMNLAQLILLAFKPIQAFVQPVLEALKALFKNVFQTAANWIEELFTIVEKLTPVFSMLGHIIGFVVSAIGEGIVVLGPLLKIILAVIAAIKIWTAVQTILNVVLAANPLGAIIVAIIAVVGAIALLVKKIPQVVDFIKKKLKVIGDFFTKVWEGIKKKAAAVFDAIKNVVINAIDKIKSAWGTIKEFFIGLWNGIVDFVLWAWNGIMDFFSWLIEKIKAIWSTTTSFFSSLWNGIVSVAKTIWEGIVSVFTSIIEKIKDVWNSLTGFFNGLWDALKNSPTEALEYIKNAFFGMFDSIKEKFFGFVDVIKDGWEKVKGFFGGIWDAGVEFFTGETSDRSDKPHKVNDLILTPDGAYSTHPDDYIMAMKNPSGIFDTLANFLQSAIVPDRLSGNTASHATQRAVSYDNSRYSSMQNFNTPINVTVNASGMTAEQARYAVEGGVRNALREAIAGSRGVIPSPESWRS